MASPVADRRNIVADLVRSSQDDEAFTTDEVMDTVMTLLLAGKLTTSEALPGIFAELSQRPAWARRIAQEDLDFQNIERDSAALRFVLEVMRLRNPAGAYRRVCDPPAYLDLGEHGRIPPGCPFAVLLQGTLKDMGAEFDPDRWTPEVVRSTSSLIFGGNQPHSCVGRNLALLELQLFARVLCREYDFKALDPQLLMTSNNPIAKSYKDGLRAVISRKSAV